MRTRFPTRTALVAALALCFGAPAATADSAPQHLAQASAGGGGAGASSGTTGNAAGSAAQTSPGSAHPSVAPAAATPGAPRDAGAQGTMREDARDRGMMGSMRERHQRMMDRMRAGMQHDPMADRQGLTAEEVERPGTVQPGAGQTRVHLYPGSDNAQAQ